MLKNTVKPVQNPQKALYKVLKGQVAIFLLCTVKGSYAIIDRDACVCKKIIHDSGIAVNMEDTIPGCDERIVSIIGLSNLERTLNFHGGERKFKFEVSLSQEPLIRVLEVLEAAEHGLHCCRLLTVKGKEKIKLVLSLDNVVGAFVKVLPVDDVPLCAHQTDDLIQVSTVIL